MKKAILLAVALTLTAISAQAQMGWTLKQCTDQFGTFNSKESIQGNRTDYKWVGDNLAPMEVIFMSGKYARQSRDSRSHNQNRDFCRLRQIRESGLSGFYLARQPSL